MFLKKKLKVIMVCYLFIEDNSKPSLWMKNTFIPLDAIFMDHKGE